MNDHQGGHGIEREGLGNNHLVIGEHCAQDLVAVLREGGFGIEGRFPERRQIRKCPHSLSVNLRP